MSAAQRRKLISELENDDEELFQSYEEAQAAAEEIETALATSRRLKANKRNLDGLTIFAIQLNDNAYNDERVKQLCEWSNLPASRLPEVCFESRR